MIKINREDLNNKLNENPFKSITEAVYEILLNDIVNFTLLPDTDLIEAHIADFYNISRSPVREAIQLLEKEGFVVRNYKKSAIVAPFNAKDYINLTNFRYIIEPAAAGYAAVRATDKDLAQLESYALQIEGAYNSGDYKSMLDTEDKFHEYIVICSKNRYLISAYKSVRQQIKKYRIYTTSDNTAYYFIVNEHYIILDSIRFGNKDTAECASKRHISLILGKNENEIFESNYKYMQARFDEVKQFLSSNR